MSKIAVLFPGQGSQSLGMLSDFETTHPSVLEHFKKASEVLGYDLWDLIQKDEARLNQTRYTQPALLVASYALWQLWCETGAAMPDYLAGHSLGEYSALLCAGAFSFEEAVQLTALRGEYMEEAVGETQTAMAAILGLEDEAVQTITEAVSKQLNQVVVCANFNTKGQVVIAGVEEAVLVAMEEAKAAGAKLTKQLAVSVPSHTPLMEAAATRLLAHLSKMDIQKPQISVIHNVDLSLSETPDEIREALVKQLYSPVRWTQTQLQLEALGVTHAFECGPGQVLSKLLKRTARSIASTSLNTPAAFNGH